MGYKVAGHELRPDFTQEIASRVLAAFDPATIAAIRRDVRHVARTGRLPWRLRVLGWVARRFAGPSCGCGGMGGTGTRPI